MSNTQYGKIGNGKKFHIIRDGKTLCGSKKEAKDIVSDVESDNVCKRCQAKVTIGKQPEKKNVASKVAISNSDKRVRKAIENEYLFTIAEYASMTMGKSKEFIKNSPEIAKLKEHKQSLRDKLVRMGWVSHKNG